MDSQEDDLKILMWVGVCVDLGLDIYDCPSLVQNRWW